MSATRSDSARAREAVRTLARARRKIDEQYVKLDDELTKAIAHAYKLGVSAIDLAQLTGLTRTNIYDRLEQAGVTERQQPKNAKVES